MIEVSLDKLKPQIADREFSALHAADFGFSMSHKPGYAAALWNFTVAMLDAEAEDFAAMYDVAGESHDLTHLCGFHKFRFAASRWEEMRWFLTRVWDNPRILALRPALKGYIEHVCENSRVRRGRYHCPLGLVGSVRLPWRTPEWHKRRYRAAHPLAPLPCAGCSREFAPRHGNQTFCDPCRSAPRRRAATAPLTEFWPYIPTRPTDDHALLIAVDALVPKGLHDSTRADICQDMIVAILTGEVTLDELRDARPKYLRRFMQGAPSKYGHLSLDAPMGDEDNRTLGQMIAAEYR